MDIHHPPLFHYEPHAKKTLKKQEQSTSIVDPLAYVAHTTSAPALSSPSTPSPQPTAQSPNDALMATMTQIANLLSGFQKQFPTPIPHQLPAPNILSLKTHATVHDVTLFTEQFRGRLQVMLVIQKDHSQYFKDKALLMEAKEKGDVLDAEAEAFLADVECTAPYDQPQALTTTNMFQANHEDAYDSDVDEGPNAAVAFMANLSSTSATNNPVNEVHSNDNQIFDNVDYQLSQDMHQEEHLDSDAETEIDDNTIPYHQYLLDTEAQNVPTEVSADTSDKVSMIAILTDLQTQLDGHAKVNQEKCLEIETLKNELLQCKQEICRLDTHKVKLDLENKVRQEQALVIQRNMRNAELVQENDLLKSTLSGKEKSIEFLQSEKEKIFSEKKDLADSYLDEIVCLKKLNKVARDMLQRFNMPTHTIPMLSKKPKAATADLHKDLLGTRNPGLGYMAKRAQPVLYDARITFASNSPPLSIWIVKSHGSPSVSMKKMKRKTRHFELLCENLDLQANREPLKFLELEAEVLKQQTMCIDTSSASNAIFEINKLRKQLQGKDDTIRNLDAQINIMKVLNVGSTEDGLKVENVSLKRQYDELSKANTHSRTAYTEKLSALTTQHTKLQAQVTGKTSSGPSTSETPTVLAPEVHLRPSLKPTQKPIVHPNKQTNVCVPMSTGVNPTSGASKTVPKRAPRNHSSLPAKNANARRVEAHHRL
ncbi:hypothetical protein Tco_0321475 [Tanacetum coccineum]